MLCEELSRCVQPVCIDCEIRAAKGMWYYGILNLEEVAYVYVFEGFCLSECQQSYIFEKRTMQQLKLEAQKNTNKMN